MSVTVRAARTEPADPGPEPGGRRASRRAARPATGPAARPAARSAGRQAGSPGRLTVAARVAAAEPARGARAGRGVFTLVMCGVLSAGLLLLLVVNTSLAQGAFGMAALTARMTALNEQEQALKQELADLATPRSLHQQARDLGMVRTPTPVFLRLSDGRVLGNPVPAPFPYVPPEAAEIPPADGVAPDPGLAAADGLAPADGGALPASEAEGATVSSDGAGSTDVGAAPVVIDPGAATTEAEAERIADLPPTTEAAAEELAARQQQDQADTGGTP